MTFRPIRPCEAMDSWGTHSPYATAQIGIRRNSPASSSRLGPNSDEAAAIGYKKKSAYKRRRRPVQASA